MRKAAWAFTLVATALVMAPVVAPRGWDDFPLSTYPMFSRGDLGSVADLDHVVVRFSDGTSAPAPPSTFGTPEVMVAMKVISGAIARGEAEALCERAAEAKETATATGKSGGRALFVEVVTSRFDARRYFVAEAMRAPLERKVHARCAVPGAAR